MAEHREIQQAWSDFLSFFHKHKNVLQELSPNIPVPKGPGNVVHPGTSIPVGSAPVPGSPPIMGFPGFSQPREDGLVFLTENEAWAGHLVQVAEITNAQTGDAHAKANANLTHANQLYNTETGQNAILACYEATVVGGDGVLDIDSPIMGSTNFPNAMAPDGTSNLGNADGVLAWCAKIKPAGPNPNAAPFPHP